ncbi:MAG: hypothetical protein WCX96_03015 [Bacilli bacterium]
MDSIIILTRKQVLLNMLILIAFMVSMCFFIISLVWERREATLLKLSGASLISTLAFLSNRWEIYTLSILILATFITKRGFLENILALVIGAEDSFWRYKEIISITKANDDEIDSKRNVETRDIIKDKGKGAGEHEAGVNFEKMDSIKNDYIEFEKNVICALKSQIIFQDIETFVKIDYRNGQFIFDAIGSLYDNYFIIEIKMVRTEFSLMNTIKQINQYISSYRDYLYYSKTRWNKIKGIIIIPSTLSSPDFIDNVGILKFNNENNEFINISELEDWIYC